MKKTNLPLSGKITAWLLVVVAFFVLDYEAKAQMNCNFDIQTSLDGDCSAVVTPDDILEGTYPDLTIFDVVIAYPPGTNTYSPPNIVDESHIGMTITVEIFNTLNGNACWGSILVDDKQPPLLSCPNDETINCDELNDFLYNPPTSAPVIDENCTIDTEWHSDVTDLDACDAGTVTRTFFARDLSGNVGSCSYVVTVLGNTRPAIIWPVDRTLDCPETVGGLDPADLHQRFGVNAGYPRTAASNYCGSITFSHQDEIFDECLPYAFKIRRTWKTLDWCDPLYEESHRQFIIVQDTIAPVAACPGDVTVSTSSSECNTRLGRSPIAATDNCDPNPGVIASATEYLNSSFVVIGTGGAGPVVGPGVYYVRYAIEDACENRTICTQKVTVQDNIPPVAICDQNTVISLTSDGWGELCWTTIDDGSSDNCGVEVIQLRRPEQAPSNGQNPGDPLYEDTWDNCVIFYCADAGTQVVEMRVVDYYGNENKCWANITIEDKLPPAIICPPNVTIDCSLDVNDLANTGNVRPRAQYAAPDAGDGVAWGGCSAPTVTYVDSGYDGCAGTFTRKWTATKTVQGHNGPVDLKAECVQSITLEDTTPAEVYFPRDTTIDCATPYTDPYYTGEPELVYDCEQLGVSKTDELFDICLPSGYKIRRTWHVIDWCDPQFDLWHTQEIKVQDVTPPVLDASDVNQDIVSNNGCQEHVTLVATATDDCSNVTITNDSQHADSNGADASGYYPKGTWTVTFTATDDCGNISTETVTVRVRDTKPPTPVCLTLSMDIKASGQVELLPAMLDGGSNDNCTLQQNLKFQVQLVDSNDNPIGDPGSSIIFTCDDLGVNYVRLWVCDGTPATSNCDYCVTTVFIQDNFGHCPANGTALIAGTIQNEDGQDIDDVSVYLDGIAVPSIFPGFNTAASTNQTHVLTAEKDMNLLNGVSTFDIVLIRKHILNIEPFTSPYQWLAADINKSGSLSTIDLVNLREAILNLRQSFPNGNTSWRFVDADYNFTTGYPLTEPYPEYVSMMLMSDELSADFTGVKVGDINGNAQPNQSSGTTNRNEVGTFSVTTEDIALVAGQEYTVDFRAKDFAELIGYQFAIGFDVQALEFVNLEAGSLDGMGDANFGMTSINDGVITTSYDHSAAQKVEANQELFSITFRAQTDVNLSDVLEVSSRTMIAEAYDAALNLYNVDFVFRTETSVATSTEFSLMQNAPNPFNNVTSIGFTLPEAGDATLNVYDVTGKVLLSIQRTFAKGFNTVEINGSDLSGTGLMYYELVSGANKATKKMLILE